MDPILLAILVGGAFGFALDRVGATNPGMIIGMLNLTRLHLMRTILLAIGVGSILLFGGLLLGLVDVGHLSVKAAYSGVFIGGLLLGAGFAVAGYCPGTGLTALATGRIDALFYMLGGLLGAFAYMLTYADVKATGVLDSILGGKSTLGQIEGADYPALLPGVSGDWLGLAVGVAFVLIAILLPERFVGAKRPAARPAE